MEDVSIHHIYSWVEIIKICDKDFRAVEKIVEDLTDKGWMGSLLTQDDVTNKKAFKPLLLKDIRFAKLSSNFDDICAELGRAPVSFEEAERMIFVIYLWGK